MSILNDRIKERRIANNMTLLEVAEFLGVREATMQRYESGLIKNIKYETILKLAELFKCSPSYLMGWVDYPTVENIIPMPQMKRIPLIGKIACGTPILAEDNINEYVDIPKNIRADFALECKGDSMIGARIHDGDIVYIHQQPDVESGEIAAVLIDDEDATLKRVRKFPDKIILFPENPDFEPMVFVGEEINELRILGRAVAFTSTVK
mgnify:CR=1 FL=1